MPFGEVGVTGGASARSSLERSIRGQGGGTGSKPAAESHTFQELEVGREVYSRGKLKLQPRIQGDRCKLQIVSQPLYVSATRNRNSNKANPTEIQRSRAA